MKTTINTIELYLKKEFKLTGDTLKVELDRFERHADIGKELQQTLDDEKFPQNEIISVNIGSESYTAKSIFDSGAACTIYAAYSLLTQLRDHPEILVSMKNGFKTK